MEKIERKNYNGVTPAFLGALKRAEMLRHPCILGNPQCQVGGAKSQMAPRKKEQNQKWPPYPCLQWGTKQGGNATSPLYSPGSPTKSSKIKSGCLTPTFSGAQKRTELLRHPYILGGLQRQVRGAKSEVATSHLHSRRPPNKRTTQKPMERGQSQKWLHHPSLLGGET